MTLFLFLFLLKSLGTYTYLSQAIRHYLIVTFVIFQPIFQSKAIRFKMLHLKSQNYIFGFKKTPNFLLELNGKLLCEQDSWY